MYLWGQVWSEYVMWSSLILYLRAVLWRTGAKVSKGMKLTIVLLLTVDLTFHHWSVFWLLGLVYSLGPQNHEKWRFSFLEIWVITPKNQGCGFPWLLVYVLGSPTCACPTRSNLPDRSDRVAPIRRPAVHCNTHSFSSKWRRFTPNSCIKQKLFTPNICYTPKTAMRRFKNTSKYLSEVHPNSLNSWECFETGICWGWNFLPMFCFELRFDLRHD